MFVFSDNSKKSFKKLCLNQAEEPAGSSFLYKHDEKSGKEDIGVYIKKATGAEKQFSFLCILLLGKFAILFQPFFSMEIFLFQFMKGPFYMLAVKTFPLAPVDFIKIL